MSKFYKNIRKNLKKAEEPGGDSKQTNSIQEQGISSKYLDQLLTFSQELKKMHTRANALIAKNQIP